MGEFALLGFVLISSAIRRTPQARTCDGGGEGLGETPEDVACSGVLRRQRGEVLGEELNRRSWTHDAELSCVVVDARRDSTRARRSGRPRRGSAVLARDVRIRLASEHLGMDRGERAADLIDPSNWFDAFAASAARLDA